MKMLACMVLFCISLLSSCSHFRKEGSWGKQAYQLKRSTIKEAFLKNVLSPNVWAPAGAALFSKVSGFDRYVVERIESGNPIFNSQKEADTYSDTLNTILEFEMWTSVLFTNSMESEASWDDVVFNKLKGASIIYLARDGASLVTKQLKFAIDRKRPDGSDYLSFPSGHATEAGTYRVIVERNLAATDMDPVVKTYLNGATGVVTAASVWSRIGANAHFPSDALAGYALGSFVSGFIYDSLMNPDLSASFSLMPYERNGIYAQYLIRL